MSDNNLFAFPGESTGLDAGDIFGNGSFTDLGSADDGENPFDGMTPAEPEAAPALAAPASTPVQQIPSQPAPQPTPQPVSTPAAPTAPPVPKEQPKTPSAQPAEEEPNPLMAAMDLQEQKNARQAAAPVFAQLPVFSYNGNQEPIENTEQTFDELRLAKADDFPEFDEAQSISWSVTYGKITKSVATPRKTKIGDFKREIESSKEFMDALKKATDKRPKCIVKPTVKMQKKGEGTYKGIFPRMADARASDKTICFIPARDGHVYERRVTGAGEFITPTSGVTYLDEGEGRLYAGPPPHPILSAGTGHRTVPPPDECRDERPPAGGPGPHLLGPGGAGVFSPCAPPACRKDVGRHGAGRR